jgi:hypothetical protein
MSSYKYVVFPRGRQPAAAEVAQLQACATALAGRFAWGTSRDEPRLAIAFEGPAFDHVLASDAAFELLITRWKSHGCELIDHLKFVKNPAALKPPPALPPSVHDGRADVHTLRTREQIATKQLIAKESVARSLLAVERTLQRYNLIQRTAAAAPYVLMAAAALLTIAVGLYAREQLVGSDREPRKETIQRLATEPAEEHPQR